MLPVSKNKGPRACSTCAKAKSRCVPGPVANICERCHRLNKPCGLQTPAPPRKRRLDDIMEGIRPTASVQSGNGGTTGNHNSQTGHPASGNPHMSNGRINGHSAGGKTQQRAAPKPTRVAELERRLEDLTSRLDSVSQQQKLHNEINPPESNDPNHRSSPLDIFRLKAHWGYMYPARHLFPTDNPNLRSDAAANDALKGTFTSRQSSMSQQHAGISPPMTVVASPASNAQNSSTASGRASNSSRHRAKDDAMPASTFIPSFITPGQRNYYNQASPGAAFSAAAKRHSEVAANIAAIAGAASKQQQRYYPPTATSGGEGAATPASLPPLNSVNLTPDNIWPKNDDAEIMLSEFRKFMMPLFPFVIIPEYVTSEKLRIGRPTLWKSVMMAACHLDGTRQIAMGNQLLGEVAAAAFLQPRRTLDMLQAVLVLVGWFHYNINSFQLINFFYLARAMCVSLGISEALPPLTASSRSKKAGGAPAGASGGDDAQSSCFSNLRHNSAQAGNDADETGDVDPQTTDYPPVALEQMRTFAGTFYLVALATTTNKRPDIMMNTAYLETCCQVLERQMEYPSDAYLVQLVRIQQLSQSISVAFSLRTDGVQVGMSFRHMMQNLRQQIEAFKAQMPEAYHDDVNLVGHVHAAEILLYEAGLQEIGIDPALRDEPLSAGDRLELLWACTYAIKDLMRNRFQDYITDQPRFLCLSTFDFTYAFLTSLKLMTLQAPGWDGRRVRTELAFDDLIDRQILDLQLLAERRSQKRFRISPDEPLRPRTTNGAGAGTSDAVPSLVTATTSYSGTRSGESSSGNSSNGSPASSEADAIGKDSTPTGHSSDANGTNNTGGKADTSKTNSNDTSDKQASNICRPMMDPRQDPFTRLAERLSDLKAMISKELDSLPGDSSGALNPIINGAGPANTMGPLPFATMMDAVPSSARTDRSSAQEQSQSQAQVPMQQSANMDTEMASSSPSNVNVAGPGVAGYAGHMDAPDPHPLNLQQQQQQPLQPHQQPLHLASPGTVEATATDAPLESIAIYSEPFLSFTDATIDYMQNMDGPGLPDFLNAPGWESYMDANMGTPAYYDSWGQMNL
ncbi:hypothetical protein HMPREF1624_06516 [Sporothrix schenckii ATCC 58251]|uniref:Zn(2)-C6 fungal-type domain-containing protein n=1 Tax=Sporothrix schenckii (strain ATCC 58251 / de Perez 2211183) TaxID=1391915 RepID=U7PRT7_SPOS1|nr:hypothetical protein HMPREF1624_06516 [Sporothrix schenckii ATCC 58251]